ncbi:hypothetical protein CCR75_000442 [Bremia lactucae]|uniref:Uncharacterized protein n=1 Tax=Bremia lactucae TaxID=4779 RepID=A0A976FHF2_BRELC|nr:hypothetical protein CCR75_000442 [Bremia lactucae]
MYPHNLIVSASLDIVYMILAVRDSMLLLTEKWRIPEVCKKMVGGIDMPGPALHGMHAAFR